MIAEALIISTYIKTLCAALVLETRATFPYHTFYKGTMKGGWKYNCHFFPDERMMKQNRPHTMHSAGIRYCRTECDNQYDPNYRVEGDYSELCF